MIVRQNKKLLQIAKKHLIGLANQMREKNKSAFTW